MNEFTLQKNKFFAGLRLESHFPREQRKAIANTANAAIFLFLLVFFYTEIQPLVHLLPSIPIAAKKTLGIILIFLGLRLFIFAIERFISSTTFDKTGDARSENLAQRFNYFAAKLAFYGMYNKTNPTLLQFLNLLPETDIGLNVLIRLGISLDEYGDFLADYKRDSTQDFNQAFTQIATLTPPRDISAADILALMFNADPNFREFIISKQADERCVRLTALWIEQRITAEDKERRWWTREKLGRIPGLAKTWSTGPVFTLMQFAVLVTNEVAALPPMALIGRGNEIKLVEDALLPSFRQILFGLQILIEEALLIRNPEQVQNIYDHAQMRKQKHLGHIGREVLFTRPNARPKSRLRFAQRFRI